ncbi:hypothetical protein [Thiolapillus brandeum]|uniref:3-hydroxylacyl-ACP dehydratase n=1 Tax=Thiolapillus brandeum TaxID=1076588 RepID=A0A7U6JH81_9GAMM|nr:hypothetical protein [Thiolapillus brandeum]BAO44046.1 conserved hypothetical protein [Thiolapillus brandeum]
MNPDKAAICALVPHSGSMCLIDEVVSWDETRIVCRARIPAMAGSPLRSAHGLAAINGVEYAAQALALQAALSADDKAVAKGGYLVALKDVSWNREFLDECGEVLTIEASVLMRSDAAMIGAFELKVDGDMLVRGRLTVMNED